MTFADRLHGLLGAARQSLGRFVQAPEGQPRAPHLPAGLRARVSRWLGLSMGFVTTLTALGAAGVFAHAQLSRFEAPPPVALTASSPGLAFIETMRGLNTLRGDAANRMDDMRLFAPDALRRREASFFAGLETTTAIALSAMPVAHGENNAALRESRALMSSLTLADRPKVSGALDRLSAAATRRAVAFDRSESGVRALAAAAAEDLKLRAELLAGETGAGEMTPRAEASFHSARGAAYGWAALLRAAAQDADETDQEDVLGPALAVLDRAAHAAPLFLSNDEPMGSWRPNHLAALALELELSASALSAFARSAHESLSTRPS